MSSSTLDFIATKVLTTKDEAMLCEVKNNLYLLETVYIDEQRMKQGYVSLISNLVFYLQE
jgi:hypothetical protein